ncbi:hypothetical protein HAX54_017567 [Datura stramonium]|uniref:Uncharacterized protein n=1 Tax=Datura stramonium TaxID=4076 RepID=A0ABS8UM79_DATST|nr:hypothetical protein [Datura stramonium]
MEPELDNIEALNFIQYENCKKRHNGHRKGEAYDEAIEAWTFVEDWNLMEDLMEQGPKRGICSLWILSSEMEILDDRKSLSVEIEMISQREGWTNGWLRLEPRGMRCGCFR